MEKLDACPINHSREFTIVPLSVALTAQIPCHQELVLFKKWANPGLFLVYFCSFLVTISIQIEKSVDGGLGIRTRGRRMVGADKTTEQWRPPRR